MKIITYLTDCVAVLIRYFLLRPKVRLSHTSEQAVTDIALSENGGDDRSRSLCSELPLLPG